MTGRRGRRAEVLHFAELSPEEAAWSRRRARRDAVFVGLCIVVATLTISTLATLLLSVIASALPRLVGVNADAWAGRVVPRAVSNSVFVNVPLDALDENGGASITFAVPSASFTARPSRAQSEEGDKRRAAQREARRLAAQAGLQVRLPVSTVRALDVLSPDQADRARALNDVLPDGFEFDVQTTRVRLAPHQARAPGLVSRFWRYTDLGHFLSSPPSSRMPWAAGIMPGIWGSIMAITVCALTALPLGVGAAVFLEEFRPRGALQRRIHAFIELNIRNLAGVPSIVYGILGLTIFVQMFGLFGTQQAPSVEVGVQYHDQFLDVGGRLIRTPVEGREAPPTPIVDGLEAEWVTGGAAEPVTVRIRGDEAAGAAAPGVIEAGPAPAPQRASERSFYFLRLPFGRSVLAGGLTLMLVVLPIVIIASQEALRAVPNSLREGALATGATRWQMVSRMTLPAAVPGVMTGSILAISRAIGEAAPILVIAGIVFILFRPDHLMDDFTAMPLQIYEWAKDPKADFHNVAAAGIVVLLVVLLSFNAAAVFIRQKFQKPLQ